MERVDLVHCRRPVLAALPTIRRARAKDSASTTNNCPYHHYTTMTARPFVLAETTWKTVRATPYEVAVLPWGATEAHNYHLPYATDNIEAEHVAIEASRIAWERGAKVVVLPTIPFGVNCQQLDIPLVINMNPATQASVLQDVIDSLQPHSVRKLVVLNFHGGNHFRQMIRVLQAQTGLFLCVVDGHLVAPRSEFFEASGDHADELETSLLLHLTPDLVSPQARVGVSDFASRG